MQVYRFARRHNPAASIARAPAPARSFLGPGAYGVTGAGDGPGNRRVKSRSSPPHPAPRGLNICGPRCEVWDPRKIATLFATVCPFVSKLRKTGSLVGITAYYQQFRNGTCNAKKSQERGKSENLNLARLPIPPRGLAPPPCARRREECCYLRCPRG